MQEEFLQRVQSVSPLVTPCLPQMIKHFEEVINSKWRSDTVDSFEDLVSLLLKRDFLDERDKATWTILNKVFETYRLPPFYDVQQNERAPVSVSRAQNTPNKGSVFPDNAVEYLSSRIGPSWKNFAKGLRIPLGNIDEIEKQCGSNRSACVTEVLRCYEKNMAWLSQSKGDWLTDVMYALNLLQRDYLIDEFTRLTGYNKSDQQ